MTDHLEHIARNLENISLTSGERQAMRQTLRVTMQTSRPASTAWNFLMRRSVASVAVTLLALVGTTSAMAHRSLPGDFLYPIRLAINERVAVAVAGDEDARLDLELRQVEQAIAEEELVLAHELAALITTEEEASMSRPAQSRQPQSDGGEVRDQIDGDDLELDLDLEAELRQLQRLLDDEEAAAEIELSL